MIFIHRIVVARVGQQKIPAHPFRYLTIEVDFGDYNRQRDRLTMKSNLERL
jgi:hypothetical protein